MTPTTEIVLASSGSAAFEMRSGQTVNITSQSGVSLVAFNAGDLSERFDQARTKVYNMKLWLDIGDKLFSKLNNPMLEVVEDGFRPYGRHDLQLGPCSSEGNGGSACLENLARALVPWKIPSHSIPMPLNAFQNCSVDVVSGAIAPAPVRLSSPVALVLKAEMDLVVAVGACPIGFDAGDEPVRIVVSQSPGAKR